MASPSLAQTAVRHYSCNDGSGTNLDDTGSDGLDGTLDNGATWGTGHFGGCLVLDGTNDQVSMSGAATSNKSALTIALWAKHGRAFNSGTSEYLFCQLNAFTTTPEFSFQKFADNNFYVGQYASGNDDRVVLAASSGNWPTGTWTHYCLTIGSGTTTLYVNGVSVGSQGSYTPQAMAGGLYVGGANATSPNNYQGSIDEMWIFDGALNSTQVTNLYTSNDIAGGGGGGSNTGKMLLMFSLRPAPRREPGTRYQHVWSIAP